MRRSDTAPSMVEADLLALFLFVPADRPERFAKALDAGADAVIIDLEDAVAPGAKPAARVGLEAALAGLGGLRVPVFLRINASETEWHQDDLAIASRLPIVGIVLPKAEKAEDLHAARRAVSDGAVIALVESAAGLANAEAIARASDRLAFGSIDLAADLGCADERDALLMARSRLVLAARLAGQAKPIDGVTVAIADAERITDDASHAARLGFGGKLLIHPAQIGPARAGFLPSQDDLAWAEQIVAGASEGAAVAIGGTMVDAPVLKRARQILELSARFARR